MEKFAVETEGFGQVIDITDQVERLVEKTGVEAGLVCVSIASSTTGITTIEYEEGAVRDLQEALDRIVPTEIEYQHDQKWGDGNGFAHVRSALLKNSLALPVSAGQPVRGTWQQIVLVDFDNRPRQREVLVQVVSE